VPLFVSHTVCYNYIMYVAHAHVLTQAIHKTILLDSGCCTLRPKIFPMYQTDCVQTVQQTYSISKIPQRDAELGCYEMVYFYKPRRRSARTVGLTSGLTDRLLAKLKPKLKLCRDVTTVIGRRIGGSIWGGGEGKKSGRRKRKKVMPALSAFHRNSVVDLHRASVPHYENVRRQSGQRIPQPGGSKTNFLF
jgi:hypothetical protein